MARKQGQRTDDNQGDSVNIALGKTSPSPSHGQADRIPMINTDQGREANDIGFETPVRRSN